MKSHEGKAHSAGSWNAPPRSLWHAIRDYGGSMEDGTLWEGADSTSPMPEQEAIQIVLSIYSGHPPYVCPLPRDSTTSSLHMSCVSALLPHLDPEQHSKIPGQIDRCHPNQASSPSFPSVRLPRVSFRSVALLPNPPMPRRPMSPNPDCRQRRAKPTDSKQFITQRRKAPGSSGRDPRCKSCPSWYR